jgi:3-hydroxyisobutyrate dehydrogenase-like beta-hydroxyacid dehydrogenase
MTSRVGVLGAGMMGAAFAKTFLGAGYQVAVWNRSSEKCEDLRSRGATVAPSIDSLLVSSDIIFFNVATYENLRHLLEPVKNRFDGRIFVNLVTGTAEDAQALAPLIEGEGGRYLDGAIEGYPSDIGNARTLIAYSGPKALWSQNEQFLRLAGGASRWVGEAPGAANVFDTAMSGGFGIGCLGAFVESVHYASMAGVALSEIEGCVDYFLSLARREMVSVLHAMSEANFAGGDAPLSIYATAMKTWRDNMLTAGAPALLISAHLHAIELAVARGRGDLHIAATYLEQSPSAQPARP